VSEDQPSWIYIVVAIGGGCCILIVIAAIVFYLRRRGKNNDEKGKQLSRFWKLFNNPHFVVAPANELQVGSK
jgi:4-amino-4-deoxy-L-arabinose transferase-like glycosyltransferase